MINLDENELIESLRDGYTKLELARSKNEVKKIYEIKGWCLAIEGIIFNFAPEQKEKLINIRESIITKKKLGTSDQNWDYPTYIRKNIKL